MPQFASMPKAARKLAWSSDTRRSGTPDAVLFFVQRRETNNMQADQKQGLRKAFAVLATSDALVVEQIERTVNLLTVAIESVDSGQEYVQAVADATSSIPLVDHETLFE